MPFRQTIAAKIFGLAIILLLLTIALAGFLLYEVTRTKQDLTVVANFDVPLTQSLARGSDFDGALHSTFGKYIDPRILEHVLAQPGAEAATGGRRNMTVSFADLVGFTSLSEKGEPRLRHANSGWRDWNGVWHLREK
jgi:hypothetical protein